MKNFDININKTIKKPADSGAGGGQDTCLRDKSALSKTVTPIIKFLDILSKISQKSEKNIKIIENNQTAVNKPADNGSGGGQDIILRDKALYLIQPINISNASSLKILEKQTHINNNKQSNLINFLLDSKETIIEGIQAYLIQPINIQPISSIILNIKEKIIESIQAYLTQPINISAYALYGLKIKEYKTPSEWMSVECKNKRV